MSGGIFCKNTSNANINFGVWSISSGSPKTNFNYGVIGQASGGSETVLSHGGFFYASNGNTTYGVKAVAEPNPGQLGQVDQGGNIITPPVVAYGYGGHFTAMRTSHFNQSIFGVYSQVYNSYNFATSPNWAGYFVGKVFSTGGFVTTSDSILKQNVTNLSHCLSVISQLKPEKFNFDTVNYSYLGLPAGLQYGLTAQNVKAIVPELVTNVIHPAQYDSIGNEISPQLEFKALNYTGLIPITIQAIKELDAKVTTLIETTPPGPTVLIYPPNGATNVPLSANFTWHKAERADNYTIYINGTGLPPYNYQLMLKDTFVTINLPGLCSGYQWFVVAHNDVGSDSPPALQFSNFNTLTPELPQPPALVSPATGVSDLPLANVFTWNHADGAENYTLGISTTDNLDGIVYYVTTTDTFATAIVPLCNTKYYWFVRATNCGGNSVLSEKRSFMAYAPFVAAPALIVPLNGDIITEGAFFTWEKVEIFGANTYNIFISTTSDEAGIVYSTSLPSPMSFILPALRGEGQYYWWVTACNSCSVCSGKSEIRNFYYVAPNKTSDPILSDSTFKTNISPITDALSKVLQLNGKYFNWNLATHPELKDTTRQMGLIAQQVLPVVPEVIKENMLGNYSLDYEWLVALLIEATKEQQAQITTMTNEIDALKTSVHNCCDSNSVRHLTPQAQNNENVSIINAELTDKAAILYQNMPNPFGDGTTIRYFIPDNVNSASIVFHNEFGQELKTVEITEKGMEQINLTTTNLSGGIYTYSLVIDGKLIETKRMMKIK